jgi:dinuclear metal center YbgI/SA1388 family protein
MRTAQLLEELDALAPLRLAADWDNVGLLLGRVGGDVQRVLLTIDTTPEVVREALDFGAGMVIAYHPVIFDSLTTIVESNVRGQMLIALLHAGISVYSPHTALDAVDGGVTDWLCHGLEPAEAQGRGGDRRALEPYAAQPETQQCKLVTFLPGDQVDRVRSALATAGAGIIGEYEQCSFSSPGIGTFFGSDAANPAVGEAGRLEQVREARLEMVVSRHSVALAIETLQRFHPYEEAPIDVYDLRPLPRRNQGMGRRLVLDQPVTFDELVKRFRTHLGLEHVKYSDVSGGEKIQAIGVVPGAGASLVDVAIDQGCEVFITGEMKHHEVLAATMRGCSVILGGHTNTERGYLQVFAERLRGRCPDLDVRVSEADRTALKVT